MRAIIGVGLIGVGLVLLAIPGPGLLVIAFGIALVSSISKTVADFADTLEPPVRRSARWVISTWHALPRAANIAIVAGAVAVVAGVGYLGWRWLFG